MFGRRPGVITAVAISGILIAYVAIRMNVSVFVFFSTVDQRAIRYPEFDFAIDAINSTHPNWITCEIWKAVLGTLLGVVLVVSAIGLLMMRSPARDMGILYSLLVIPLYSAHLVLEFGFVNPAVDEWAKRNRIEAVRQSPNGVPSRPDVSRDPKIFLDTFVPAALCIGHGLVLLLVLWNRDTALAFRHARMCRLGGWGEADRHFRFETIDVYDFPEGLRRPLFHWMGNAPVKFVAAELLEQLARRDPDINLLALYFDRDPAISQFAPDKPGDLSGVTVRFELRLLARDEARRYLRMRGTIEFTVENVRESASPAYSAEMQLKSRKV